MKKKNIISLIKYYVEKNDAGFRNEAYEIAREFDASGDYQLSEYIMSLLSNVNTFVPQVSENVSSFFEKIEKSETVNMVLEAAENCLKEQDREIFIRYYFYGERLEKISAFLGLTLSNSTIKLCRVRKKIREYLTERGYGVEKV